MISRKAQEEIAGFVLVVVVVAVLVLFMIIFLARQDSPSGRESYEVGAFLDSAFEMTSDCVTSRSAPLGLPLRDVLVECRAGRTCISGKSACLVLNETFTDLIEQSWPVGTEKQYSGYRFNITERKGNESSSEFLSIYEGGCSSGRRSAAYVQPPLVVDFELCSS